jgi:PGF-pre-PGF domain-containing protein
MTNDINLVAKKNLGKTITIAEQLKGKSANVPELPAVEVYNSFNVWVGSGGIANSNNIGNSILCFKVEKSWIQSKNINPASSN